jgi:hypothetical protein
LQSEDGVVVELDTENVKNGGNEGQIRGRDSSRYLGDVPNTKEVCGSWKISEINVIRDC